MRQELLKGSLSLFGAIALFGCTDGIGTNYDLPNAKGKIALVTSVDCSLENTTSRAEYHEVRPEHLSLVLTSSDGTFYRTWESLSDFSSDQLFPVGQYTLEALYGTPDSEGPESPHFYGSTEFRVDADKTTPVSLTASLANSLLDIQYTDDFKKSMTEFNTQVHSAGGNYYDVEELKPIYTKAGNVEVFVTFTKTNGQSATISAVSFNAEAKHFYHVTLDVTNPGGIDEITLKITLDDGLTKEEIDIDISDDVLNAPAPTVTPEGFVSEEPIELVAGMSPENAAFNIIARGGLNKVVLTTSSTSLASKNWPQEIDLINEDFAALKNLGLEAIGFKNPDQMAVVDLKKVISEIDYVENDSKDNTSTFTIVAHDEYGKVSEPISLVIKTDPLILELSEGVYNLGENCISFTVTYNGNDPATEVTVQYLNTRGTRTTLYVTYTPTAQPGVYTAIADITPAPGDIQLFANADGVSEATLTVKPSPKLTLNTEGYLNEFAKFAYIPVTIGEQDNDSNLFSQLIEGATVYVSIDGSSYQAVPTEADASNKVLKISGLTPDKDIDFKIVNQGQDINKVLPNTLHTEKDIALENGDMESWSSTTITASSLLSSSSCEVWSIGGLWSSLNAYTTAFLNSSTNYSALSSTLRVQGDEAHNGFGALIRSVGFDVPNNSTGMFGNNSIDPTKYAVGELFLGSYSGTTENGQNYGIDFDVRPSSLSFWYKYSPTADDDKGYAEITLLDEQGEEIASEIIALETANEYTDKTISIESKYRFDSKKAKSLKVIFKSSNAGDTHLNSKDIPQHTGNRGLTGIPLNDYYVGAQLYIDDIVLNY